MSRNVYLCGHGMWQPKNGFFELPPNVRFTMFVDVAKVLYTNDMYKICEGTYTGEEARTIGGEGEMSRTCPNLTWTRDEAKKIPICDDALKRNPNGVGALLFFPNHLPNFLDNTGSITLKRFFTDYWNPAAHIALGAERDAHFYWACCAYLDFKNSARGAISGVNAAMTHDRHDHINYRGGARLIGKSTAR